jgi:hypothetical protein
MKQLTPEEAVISIMRFVTEKPPESVYQIMGVGRFNFIKHKVLKNSFSTLVLFLWQLSIRDAHPEAANQIIGTWNALMKEAYSSSHSLLTAIQRDIDRYSYAMSHSGTKTFEQVALQFVLLFRGNQPDNIAYAARMSVEIDSLYEWLLRTAKTYEIVLRK